ncbi:hypothetical protein HMPREF3088_03600 [Corynebacterium sp. HMSC22B11]|uniref:hypothetical protein n=1 Tax=Corynebacterium sp. HMSC22B11 TaxID=1581056 RepID=UPI0008A655FE|nr:hypothetical protein [Corynebacterium sp. HMSC22B11]OFO15422.1 hypothetical protein HMPREF3088_03600 [Corynebacterium sp. HMSC22B11]
MKRFPRTLTAAVMAGALAVGGATVAQAQIPTPQSVTVDGVEYYLTDNGRYYNKEADAYLTDEQAEEAVKKHAEDNNQTDPETEGDKSEDGKTEGDKSEDEDPAGDDNQGIPNPATKEDSKGNTWYQHLQDSNLYVDSPDKVNAEITDELRDAYAKAFPEEKEFDKKKLAWLALPAALIIGGIVYHLMKDGQTYTPDEGRKNEDPTAEEKAASDKLLGENKDEVIAQGGQLAEGADAAATDRGIAAETGSNAAARGLAALAVVAMVAAGAFAASRKLFA